jgi:hypothetical protein
VTRRTPEQVHEQDGHQAPVKSCTLCNPEPADDAPVNTESGPPEGWVRDDEGRWSPPDPGADSVVQGPAVIEPAGPVLIAGRPQPDQCGVPGCREPNDSRGTCRGHRLHHAYRR